MRSAEAESSELQRHMAAEADDMDPDTKHMVIHLQRALARLAAPGNNPCISTAPLFRDVSKGALFSLRRSAALLLQVVPRKQTPQHSLFYLIVTLVRTH